MTPAKALEGIDPEQVLYYFEEMSNIERCSGKEKPMSDYLAAFAEENGCEVWQDEVYNILIKAPGSAGGEDADPVVLHGHMDMVCAKEDGAAHDFSSDPLDLHVEDGWVKARETSLGADNGIGVAYMMALIEDDEITHPPLECVITVMEETGKKGMEVFDPSRITADRMLDFNWINDEEILVGCSGDISYNFTMPTNWEATPTKLVPMSIKVSGLKGGHCEWDIHKQRGNAIKILARLIRSIQKEFDIRLATIEGGVQNNAIPSTSSAEIFVNPEEQEAVADLVENLTEMYKKEYEVADPNLGIQVAEPAEASEQVFSEEASEQLPKLIHLIPDGLLSINRLVDADKSFTQLMEETGSFPTGLDNNLGILRTEEDEISMTTTITSALNSEKYNLVDKLETVVQLVGAGTEMEQFGVDAAPFPYEPDAELTKIAEDAYEESYGYAPAREVNCCSLQLGMLIQAADLECVSIGTDIEGIHSPAEKMNLESVDNTWKFVQCLMEKLSTDHGATGR